MKDREGNLQKREREGQRKNERVSKRERAGGESVKKGQRERIEKLESNRVRMSSRYNYNVD